jgi:uncharacterized protein (TIGR03437 family)
MFKLSRSPHTRRLVVRAYVGMILFIPCLLVPPVASGATVTVRSGNGSAGGRDSAVTFLLGPATGPVGHVFTASDFSAAQTGPAAFVVTPNPLWIPSLAADESAKWIGTNPNAGCCSGNTALYAVSFQITSAFTSATLELFFAVDDGIGDGYGLVTGNSGIYLNGSPACRGGFTGASQQQSVSCDVSSLLRGGTNWLYIEDGNAEGAAGLLFSATITTADFSGAGLLLNVPGTAMPWLYSTASGGLNSKYQFGLADGSNPVIVSSANGINFSAGSTLTVTYLNGSVSVGPEIALPYTDASGFPGNTTTSTGTFAPGHYMNPVGYISELVGVFTDNSGSIIGTPFALGDGPTPLTIPVGATQLQLGVDDDKYSDNVGSWVIQVISSSVNPNLPSINSGGVVSSADATAPVSPGSIASVYGTFPVSSSSQTTVTPWPTTLSGLSMQFSGISVPLLYASPLLVNVQVPWELNGQTQALATATVANQTSAPQIVNLAAFAPGIFVMNAQGQGAILDSSYLLVDSSNPAIAGSTYIQIYCTGLGPVTNQPATGASAPISPLAITTTTPTLTVGGMPATVLFSGLAPTAVGLYQVNAQVPTGVTPGSAVPVVLKIGGTVSNTVKIAVQSTPSSSNPEPTATSLSPALLPAGSSAATLTISGTGFLSNSSVTFNGIPHAVSFQNAFQLSITLTAPDLAAAGIYPVIVANPTPGGGSSQPLNFTVTPALNPQPMITSLSPSSAPVGSGPLTLTINGAGFLSISSVTFNGISHAISFQNGSQLTITLTASDLAVAETDPVVVSNPSPGGGNSQPATFTVTAPIPISLTGNWTGAWLSIPSGAYGLLSANFTQNNSAPTTYIQGLPAYSVTGTITLNSSPCFGVEPVSGLIAGNAFAFTAAFAVGQQVAFDGLLNTTGTAVSSGAYVVQSGLCAGDYGIFTATKN